MDELSPIPLTGLQCLNYGDFDGGELWMAAERHRVDLDKAKMALVAPRHERLNQLLNIVARANKPKGSFRLSNSHYSTSHRFILTSNLRILLRYGRLQLTHGVTVHIS